MKSIKNLREYRKHMRRFEEIFNAKKGTPESAEANKLSKIICAYEKKHWPIPQIADQKKKEIEHLNKIRAYQIKNQSQDTIIRSHYLQMVFSIEDYFKNPTAAEKKRILALCKKGLPKKVAKNFIDREKVAHELFKIHRHDDYGFVIYREKDLIPALQKLGLPKPDWEANAKTISKNKTWKTPSKK